MNEELTLEQRKVLNKKSELTFGEWMMNIQGELITALHAVSGLTDREKMVSPHMTLIA